jgi:acetyltransferase-like isoleucine patch superfamily enzyme
MKKIKFFIRACLENAIFIYSYIYSYRISKKWVVLKNFFYTSWISREFKSIGNLTTIKYSIDLLGGKYISIGAKTTIGQRTTLTAWDKFGQENFQPEILIGNNTNIGDDSHITANIRIEIGNNVLTGKKITVTDNAHGKSEIELLATPPNQRSLFTKGIVTIEDGVWIGEKVTILADVTIGKNAIIGANSVVTKNIPENAVAAGIPAKIIKIMGNDK